MEITLVFGLAHPIARLSTLKSIINLILGIFPIIFHALLAAPLFFSDSLLLCQGFFVQTTEDRFKDT